MLLIGSILIILVPILIVWALWYFDVFKLESQKSTNREKVDLRNYRVVFMSLALLVTLLLSSFIINYEFPYDSAYAKLVENDTKPKTIPVFVPPTRMKREPKPPKPKIKPKAVEFKEEEKEKIIEEIPELITPEEDPDDPSPLDDFDEGDEVQVDFSGEPEWGAAVLPKFPNGEDAMIAFIQKGIRQRLTPRTKSRLTKTEKIYVKFIIEKDGTLSGIEIPKGRASLIEDLNTIAVDIVKTMPKWSPAQNEGGFPVRLYYIIPIEYKVKN